MKLSEMAPERFDIHCDMMIERHERIFEKNLIELERIKKRLDADRYHIRQWKDIKENKSKSEFLSK